MAYSCTSPAPQGPAVCLKRENVFVLIAAEGTVRFERAASYTLVSVD